MSELARRELASRYLQDFVQYTMPEFFMERFHGELFGALEQIERGELKRLIVQMPPRAGKSEIISKRFPAWFLGRHPDKIVTCCSYGADLAVGFGRKTREIIKSNPFRNVFSEFALADDKSEAGNWETKQGGGYYAIGVGGGLTGRGFDIGIIDDPVKDRQEAESAVTRERIWEWYTSTFLTRQQGSDAAIIILMTRWNDDDLVGRILNDNQTGWKILTFPAIDEDNNPLCTRSGYGIEFYEAQKKSIGVRDFAALYQQDPIASMGKTFSKEDFKYFALSDLRVNEHEVGIFVDPAFSTRDGSDDTAIAVVARSRINKELFVLDLIADPILPSDAYNLVISLFEKWRAAKWNIGFISVEDVSISKQQQLFLDGFRQKMREIGKFYTLLPFSPQSRGKKEERIKYALEPLFNQRAISFRSDESHNPNWMKLEEQLLKFPVAKHDDLADVLAQSAIVWQERVQKSQANRDYNQNLMRYI